MKISFKETHSQRTQLEKQPTTAVYSMTLEILWPTQILNSPCTFDFLLQVWSTFCLFICLFFPSNNAFLFLRKFFSRDNWFDFFPSSLCKELSNSPSFYFPWLHANLAVWWIALDITISTNFKFHRLSQSHPHYLFRIAFQRSNCFLIGEAKTIQTHWKLMAVCVIIQCLFMTTFWDIGQVSHILGSQYITLHSHINWVILYLSFPSLSWEDGISSTKRPVLP